MCRPCTPRRSCAPHSPRGVRLALSIIQGGIIDDYDQDDDDHDGGYDDDNGNKDDDDTNLAKVS